MINLLKKYKVLIIVFTLFVTGSLLFSCAPKILPPTIIHDRIEIHDTIDSVRLVPVFVKIQTRDTSSHLENKYAFSDVLWSNGYLTHSLGIKPVAVPVSVPVTTFYKDKTITVNILTNEQKEIIKDYPKIVKERDGLKNDVGILKESIKTKNITKWRLILLLSISVVLLFRKPIWILISKLIKPI